MPNSTHQRLQPQPPSAAESWAELPERIRELLKLEELDSPAAWLAASAARRSRIFGVPPGMQRVLTDLARGAP